MRIDLLLFVTALSVFLAFLFRHEDAAKALDDSKEKVFFGAKIIVTPHQGYGEIVTCSLW